MTDFHNKWRDVKGPRFKRGDMVRIPHVTPGRDSHNPRKTYRVVESHAASYDGFHKLDGLPSIWPGTRLERA